MSQGGGEGRRRRVRVMEGGEMGLVLADLQPEIGDLQMMRKRMRRRRMGRCPLCAKLCMGKRDLKAGCYGMDGNYVDDGQNYRRIVNSSVGSFHPSDKGQPPLSLLHHTL